MAKIDEIKEAVIIDVINNSKNWSNVCTNLGISDNEYNRSKLKQVVEKNKLNIEHFVFKLTRDSYESNPKLCKNCGKPIPWDNRRGDYCSRSCSTTINNKGVIRHKVNSDRYCKNCGKELDAQHKIYCSQECQLTFEQNEYVNRWKQGLETGLSGRYGVSDRIRRYLFEKYDNKCEICGWGKTHPITGNIPLQIHHIDGDCTNNKEENLQLLCPNCHCLTDNYGSLNKNATRIDTRKRS